MPPVRRVVRTLTRSPAPQGKALLFDDSYEHSVYWDPPVPDVDLSAAVARIVLIVDVVHPDVAPACAGAGAVAAEAAL